MKEKALQLVLLFHSGGPWDDAKRETWQNNTLDILGRPQSSTDGRWSDTTGWEATTKVLCDCVRKVLNPMPQIEPLAPIMSAEELRGKLLP